MQKYNKTYYVNTSTRNSLGILVVFLDDFGGMLGESLIGQLTPPKHDASLVWLQTLSHKVDCISRSGFLTLDGACLPLLGNHSDEMVTGYPLHLKFRKLLGLRRGSQCRRTWSGSGTFLWEGSETVRVLPTKRQGRPALAILRVLEVVNASGAGRLGRLFLVSRGGRWGVAKFEL